MFNFKFGNTVNNQPPSGGCVLKQQMRKDLKNETCPAAFGRLCVETLGKSSRLSKPSQPPSGGCVLKHLKRCVHNIRP